LLAKSTRGTKEYNREKGIPSRMPETYQYVRFTWWGGVDLEEVSEEFRGSYAVEPINMPEDDRELSLAKIDRERLKVWADTLKARLSPYKAVLFQRDPAPFTPRDLRLRNRILELYPRTTPTPFPIGFSVEPKFEVSEEPPITNPVK
jgi:hypothetical protein